MSFRTNEVPGLPGLETYVESISAGFCPYISLSTKSNAMRNSVYALDEKEGLEASIFYLGLLHTEILRDSRLNGQPRVTVFACDNLIFRFNSEDEIDGRALFAWPHWLLKIHYTEVGILFGKFWLGEEENSQAGVPIPPPPYHILSIRSAIVKRDPKFFQKAPNLLGDLLESDDDGRDVAGVSQILKKHPSRMWTTEDVRAALQVLQGSGVYEIMKDKAKKEMGMETRS